VAPLEAVALSDDASLAVAVGARGLVMQRTPEASWRVVQAGAAVDLHAAVIMGERNDQIYVGGESGTIIGSSDRGATWAAAATHSTAALYSLDDL
jgi:photosystem II stability/assembly factor-like uncharacterized protein